MACLQFDSNRLSNRLFKSGDVHSASIESFYKVAVHIVRGLRYSSEFALWLASCFFHVVYHLRIFYVVVAFSRYDDFGEVFVVELDGLFRVSHLKCSITASMHP
jgi:hypothetical protein